MSQPALAINHQGEQWPSQCNCGHIFLEKYRFPTPVDGNIGFAWCGFCRTKRMVKAHDASQDHLVEQRYNELLNDSSAINEFLHEAPDATPEELSDYLYKVAQSDIDEECEK